MEERVGGEDLEDISCLADALLLGGSDGSAPNLKAVGFEYVTKGILAQLGSHLFALGGLASITRLEFVKVDFDKHSMTDLVDGFRQSGHAGGTLQTLMFQYAMWDMRRARLPWMHMIADLGAGILPNLQELLMPSGGLLDEQVPELVEVLGRVAPCARTLRTVVLSEQFLEPADIEPLEAILLHATVTLG